MPSIINSDSGATSGSAGFKFAAADDGILEIQNNGNTAITVGNTGQATFATPVSQPGGFTLRNKIINGGMAIDQRNGGASQTITAAAALAYTIDRWYAYCTGANVTGQRIAGSGDTEYRYRFTGAASVTKIGFAQRIEATNSYDLNGSTATLSVDLANSLLTTVTWTAWYANTADTFGTLASPTKTQITTGTFTVNSTVTRYSTQISIPSAATTGIEIEFSVGAQTSGTWIIGNVQLERGSAATPFEQRPVGMELSLCQRYYEQVGGSTAASFGVGYNWATTGNYAIYYYKVTKRVLPTLNTTGTAANYQVLHGATATNLSAVPVISTANSTTQHAFLEPTVASGLTAGQGSILRASGSASTYIGFNSEL